MLVSHSSARKNIQRLSGKTILLVEDDVSSAKLFSLHLSQAGYNVVIGRSGTEALQLARRLRLDAILLDILLPDIDGWEVLMELKASPGTADIPVIVVSVLEQDTFSYRLGAVSHLVKPVMRTKLLQTLEQSLLRTDQQGKNAKVLVVSHDLARLDAVSVLLDSAGYHVFQSQGIDCLETARSILPDIIVIDMPLDSRDDSKVISALWAEPEISDIPGLVMAARPLVEAGLGQLQRQCYFLSPDEDLPSTDFLAAINRCLLQKG